MASPTRVLTLTILLTLALACCTAVNAVNDPSSVQFSSLTRSIVVTTTVNGNNVTNGTGMTYAKDEMMIHWHLNQSLWGTDAAFKKVVLQLCFGAPSQASRPWRQPNNVLSHSKSCKYTIASQPYNAFGNNTVWRPSQDTPGAQYFVRAWVLNSTESSATISANSVAYGQNTDPSMNTNLVVVTPFGGTAIGIDIYIVCISVVSYVALACFFVYERYAKKNK
ncbi:unnamed protein product [Closterium sp. NIES-64]|nr:unnamed protein product [Closterium sp. NIES-65]CAI6001510.1 unnamed protein product [Closterium sp. NIES-64]CAI6007275.1 unnamed protein product [Closterium sp. NIES-65]